MCLCLHQPISGVAGYATKQEKYMTIKIMHERSWLSSFLLETIKKLENSIQPFFVIYLNTVCKCLKQKEKEKEKRGGISI